MKIQATDKVLILGQSGCGKSYLGRQLQKIWPKRIIIDSLNEYDDANEIFSDFIIFSERLKKAHNENENEFEFIFQFQPEPGVSKVKIFDEIIRLAYYMGNILIVIEEVQLFTNPHNCPHWLETALMTGRHRGVSLMFTTQRPGLLNKNMASQCQHIFCGRINEKNDLNYVSSFLFENSKKLLNLKNRNFIYFNPEGVTQISTEKTDFT